ncbi:MAG: sigma-70 family RNA polymerase sigma factor, partial [Planctomycetota bacterium]
AVDHFNPWKGFRFSTYACTAIGRLLRRQGRREVNYRQMFPVQNDGSLEGTVNMPEPRNDQTGLFVERLNRALEQNLGKLTELESAILSLRFPSANEKSRTFLEIGKSVGLSKERVRQIQNNALEKLRDVLLQDPLLSD